MITQEHEVFTEVTLASLEKVAQEIVRKIINYRVWLFQGEMGSGKTTLIKMVCKILGVTGPMSSPSFSIVNEYENDSGERIYHFDFYRIEREIEAKEIGIEEYFYSGHPCFVEWPEKIPSLIPLQYAEVNIQVESNTKRKIAIALHDGKKENRF